MTVAEMEAVAAYIDAKVELRFVEAVKALGPTTIDEDALVARIAANIRVPKDGDPGTPGKDAEPVDEEALITKIVARVPKPENGKDAEPVDHFALLERAFALLPKPRDGKDGITEDQLAKAVIEMEARVAERIADSITLDGRELKVGDKVLRVLPIPEYRGVFKQDQQYEPGDVVSWASSTWLCRTATAGKPLDGDPNWVLMAKKGRDGRDRNG